MVPIQIKKLRHIEFLPDDLGIIMNQEMYSSITANDPELVEKLISMLGWDPQFRCRINDHGDTVPI